MFCDYISTIPPKVEFSMGARVSKIMSSPKDVHNLVPETCDNVTLKDNRDFASVMKLRILRWKDYLDCLTGYDRIPKVIMRWRQDR